MNKTMRHKLCVTVFVTGVLLCAGCGHYPAPISSRWDIFWTSSSEYMIAICGLPLTHWPKLQKFSELEHLCIAEEMAPDITDEHIRALSMLKMPRLRDLSLAYCRQVTDDGIRALTNLPSIKSLQLIGIGVTDELKTLVTGMSNLDGLNVRQCKLLTIDGFLSLTNPTAVREVAFSTENMAQAEVARLISEVSNGTWWTIDDRSRKLSLEPLQQLANRRGIRIDLLDGNSIKGLDEIIKTGYQTKMDK